MNTTVTASVTILVGVALGFALATPRAQVTAPALQKLAAFDLPGPGGKRFDYLTIDAPTSSTSPTSAEERKPSWMSARTRS
jgi:hypothetical protein